MTNIDVYKAVAQRYDEKYQKIAGIFCEGRFRDVVGNILTPLSSAPEIMEFRGVTRERKERFVQALRKVRKYFRLLEQNPDFLEAERTQEGAFPDLYAEAIERREKDGKGIYWHYIELAAKRLEEKVKPRTVHNL